MANRRVQLFRRSVEVQPHNHAIRRVVDTRPSIKPKSSCWVKRNEGLIL